MAGHGDPIILLYMTNDNVAERGTYEQEVGIACTR
jgi:hypothetical protein